MALSGVIFDFDGVLADSERLHLQAFQDVLREYGVTLTSDDYYHRYIGFDDEGVFRAVAGDRDWDLQQETLPELVQVKGQRFGTLVSEGKLELFPGAADCIRRVASEIPVGIASGAQSSEIETLLADTNLRQHFRTIVASGDTPRSKPEPDPYLRALELLRPCAETDGHDPNGCFVAIEDSWWGIQSAVKAGLHCIGIAQTPRAKLETAHIVLPTIAEVTLDSLRQLCTVPLDAGHVLCDNDMYL